MQKRNGPSIDTTAIIITKKAYGMYCRAMNEVILLAILFSENSMIQSACHALSSSRCLMVCDDAV